MFNSKHSGGLQLPYWIDLPHGVRVFVRPFTQAVQDSARAMAMRQARVQGPALASATSVDDDTLGALASLMFTQALARTAFIKWDGVCDRDGAPLRLTPEAINDLLLIDGMADAFRQAYAPDQRPVHNMPGCAGAMAACA